MKRISLMIALLVMCALPSWGDVALYGFTVTSLKAVTAAGTGVEFALPQQAMESPAKFTWQVSFSAQPTAQTTQLEGSIDNVKWFVVDVSNTTAAGFTDGSFGEARAIANKGVLFLRCDLLAAGLNLNGANETCKILVTKP
jgi:hypothetical protein